VLLFNISGGRNGYPFLDGVLKKMSENLTKYGSSEKAEAFFDEVIFCTNVTYADGHFKGGTCRVLLISSVTENNMRRFDLCIDTTRRDNGVDHSTAACRGLVFSRSLFPGEEGSRSSLDRTCYTNSAIFRRRCTRSDESAGVRKLTPRWRFDRSGRLV